MNDLKLNIDQKIIFFEYLLWFLGSKTENDRYLRICRRQIENLIDDLNEENEKTEISKQNIEFEELLKHLETLPNIKEKISYLKQAKAEYVKNRATWKNFSGLTFDKKCESEIKKLKELQSFEFFNSINRKTNSSEENINDRQKDKNLTLDRAVLIFNYLFNYAKVNAHNTAKVEFISFLTGFSKNTIVQKLSRLHEKADLNFIGYEKDMKIVRSHFEELNLSEITKAIDNDLEI